MNWKQKYFKYKSKYTRLKNSIKGGECNLNNFGFIQLDSFSLDKKSILTNPLFNLKKEIKLVDLICNFLTPQNYDGVNYDNINDFIFDNNFIRKIKTKLVEITGINDINHIDDCQFIVKIFGNIRDKNNLEKIIKFYNYNIKYNIYGFDKFQKFKHEEKFLDLHIIKCF